MAKRKGNDNDDGGSGKKAKKVLTDEGSSTIPIFLKKTYTMIDTCDSSICCWSPDGDMFVIKDQDRFAAEIIPQYFDHNKFSSFARQLNFYGFRKIQSKPIRNEDFDVSTAKYVTFFNEKFKRDRYDLLKEIQRSTRGGGNASAADQAREVERLRSRVATLEQRVQQLDGNMLDMKMKFDVKVQMACMNFLSGGGSQPSMGMPNLPSMASSFGASDMAALSRAERSFGSIGRNPIADNTLLGEQAVRAFSSGSKGGGGGATLPPHPKQKQLPPLVGGMNDARQASGGLQNNMNLAGMGLNSPGMNSSMLLRNAWEDKFFSTLMMSEGGSRAASLAGMGMAGNNNPSLAALAAAQQMQARKTDQAAAFLEAQIRNNNGYGFPSANGEALKRQTTAEILLEAAGEVHKKETGEISRV